MHRTFTKYFGTLKTADLLKAQVRYTKRAVLNGELKRALGVSSDQQAIDRSVQRIKNIFEQNGYPASVLDKAIKNNFCKRDVRRIKYIQTSPKPKRKLT